MLAFNYMPLFEMQVGNGAITNSCQWQFKSTFI